jgi:hypothetical protein
MKTAQRSPGQKDEKAEQLIARNDRLKAERGHWDTLWQEIADYVQPRKSEVTNRKTPDVMGYTDRLFNLTAVRSNQVLASGQMDYLFSGRWFSYDPPPEVKDDEAKAWYQACTEVTMRELARSNWNLEVHEMLLDRGGFGTAAILCEEGTRRLLNFVKFDVGTFSVCEDHEGIADTLIREFEMTARQAKQKFGEENLGPIVCKACCDPKKCDQKFKFIHAIYPREEGEYDPKKIDGPNKPIASCYVSVDDRCFVKEDGYFELPHAVSRFLKWGAAAYGYSPSIEALPTVKQVNFIEKNMDALAEIKAFPRILIPEGLEGDVDLAAGGATIYDPNAPGGAMPKEWGTAGEYNIGKERIEMKDKAIREAYHVDLFQMLQQIEREMTAFEVQQRLAEKVTAFSPTFYRLQVEVTNPLLVRVFNILFRAGKFPEPPPAVFVDAGDGMAAVAVPEVTLTSKLAMAIKAAENQAFGQMMQILTPVAQVQPDILDNYDMDKATRGIGRNLGVPTDWERSEDDVAALREQRAQAQQQAQAVALAQGGAKAAKDASAASPEVRKAMMGGAARG